MTAPMRIPQGLGKRVGGGRPGPVQSQPKQSFMDWWDKIVAGREQSADPFGAEVAAQAQYGDPASVLDRFEGDQGVLVSDNREAADSLVPRGSLPAGISEGDVMRGGAIDSTETGLRQQEGAARLERLRPRDPGGDISLGSGGPPPAGGSLGGRLTQKKRMERGGRGPDVLDELEPTGSPRMLMRKGSGWAPAPQDPEAAGIAQLRASGMSDDDLLGLNPYGEPPTPELDPKTLAALMQTLNLGR